jgi:signal transduction histidine kinase
MSEPRGESGDLSRGLRAVAEFAGLLYDDADFFVGVLDEEGRLWYANEAALSLVDADEAAVYGTPFWETPWVTHDAGARDVVREGVASALDGDRRRFVTTHPSEGQTDLDVEMDVRPLWGPPESVDAPETEGVFAVVVTGRDVTQRTNLAAAQRANLDALEGLYETAADSDLSFEERVRALLRVGKDRLGLGEAFYTKIDGDVQFVKTSIADHPLLQEGEQADLANSYCKPTISSEEMVVMNDVGESAFADDSAFDTFGLECYLGAKLEVGDAVHGTICFADTEPRATPIRETEEAFVKLLAEWLNHELDHQRRQQSLERQNERLDRFADVVTHDLRSPLNVATGHVDLAVSEVEPGSEAAEHLENAARALERMDELVEEVRSLAKQGEVVGEFELVSLSAVAREAAETALPEEATLELDVAAGDELSADGERLRTVFENLYANAVNHGGPAVSVVVGSFDPQSGDGAAGFYVADDGPGFEQDDPDVVFEEGHTTRSGGTGYGLGIVSAVADAHGWTATAGDSESGGARVDFRDVEFSPDVA